MGDTNGRVCGICTVEVAWEKDNEGRWKMNEKEGSEKIFEADMVLLAMGFLGPESVVLDQLKLDKDPRSNVQTPNAKYRSSVSKVYAAGGTAQCHILILKKKTLLFISYSTFIFL